MEKKIEGKGYDSSFFMKDKSDGSFREERTSQNEERGSSFSDRPRRPRTEGGDRERRGSNTGERRSYNPNFTSENKPRSSSSSFGRERSGGFGNSNRDERKSFSHNDNKEEGGERRSFSGNREGGSGERRSFGGNREGGSGERRSFGGNREGGSGERRSFGGNREGGSGERRSFGENREGGSGERRSFGGNREGGSGERRSFGGNREGGSGERRSFGGNREGGSGERRSFGGNRESGSGERRSFGGNREGGDRKPFSSDRERAPRREGGDREFKPRENREGGRSVSSFRKESARSGGYTPTREQDSDNKRPRVGRTSDRPQNDYQKKSFDEENNLDPNEPFSEQPLLNREIRLNRFVAMSGVCSRREADELIQSGDITINGEVITEFGTKVKPGDSVCYKGEELRGEKLVYIVMNKPKGVVTTVEDPNADKTIIDLLEDKVSERVFPVGRLDKNSLGVILLTNDGDLASKLTHPSFEKKKIYHVFLDKNVKEEDMERLANGVELEDGFIFADEISYVNESKKEVGIEIHSGRNRIVRRLFEHLGYQVNKLDRVYFAGLTKKGIKRGLWRYLTAREVSMLKGGSYK